MESCFPVSKTNLQQPANLGLLLVGHGTRDPQGLAEFQELAQLIVDRSGDMPVAACFLELAEPGIASGIDELLSRGVRQIIVAPLLLFAAGHAKRDIPDAVAAALNQHCSSGDATGSAQIWCQLPPLACHEKVLELSALRYVEAKPIAGRDESSCGANGVANRRQTSPATTLVLVGRGSSDPAATAELHRLARLRAESLPRVQVEVCFYALAEPRLEPTLVKIANSVAEHVIVQSHLLFSGDVRRGIEDLAAQFAVITETRQKWHLGAPLGSHPLLADALWSMVEEAIKTPAES